MNINYTSGITSESKILMPKVSGPGTLSNVRSATEFSIGSKSTSLRAIILP